VTVRLCYNTIGEVTLDIGQWSPSIHNNCYTPTSVADSMSSFQLQTDYTTPVDTQTVRDSYAEKV